MKEQLTNYLRETYPDVLGDVYFECGDGWFLILDVLCSQLRDLSETAVYGKDNKIPEVVQIKEKFGTLRFYIGQTVGPKEYYEAIYFAIRMAEKLSARTCESCGRPSYPSGDYRIKNYCPWCQSDARETFNEEFVRECENYIEAKKADEVIP